MCDGKNFSNVNWGKSFHEQKKPLHMTMDEANKKVTVLKVQ
jgi:hypothetical protein